MVKKCPWCNKTVSAPEGDIFVKLHCSCGSYCQTDFLMESSFFPGDAALALGIERMPVAPDDVFDYKAMLDLRQGDIVACVDGRDVVMNWARVAAAPATSFVARS